MPDLTVILVTWNRRYLVNHALHNILRNKFPFKLVVIDNASTDGTREYLLEHRDEVDELILNKKNIGCLAFNQGIQKAEGNYVSLQADDHILQDDWIEKMYRVVKTVEKKIRVGWICSANTVAYPKQWYKTPMTFEEWLKHPEIKNLPWNKRWLSTTVTKTFKFGKVIYKEAKAVGSGGTIIPLETLRKVGLFRSYGLRGLYDGEWNSRIRVYGFSGGYTTNACLIHVRESYLNPEKYKRRKASLIPTPKQKAQMKKHFRENAEYVKRGIPPPSVPKAGSKMKIGVIAAGWAFMPELLKELRAHHAVKILKGFTRSRVEEFMREIDVLYSEWCSNYMTYVTHVANPTGCKIVCRLHRHEVHGSWMKKVIFTKIDLLMLVNNFMKGYCLKYQPKLAGAQKIKVIQLGVDTEKFVYNPGRGYGKRIGWVGWIKDVKQPLMVSDLMRQLPDWQLRFLAVPSVYKNLAKQVAQSVRGRRNIIWMKEKIPHEKMPGYYRKIDIMVNTSVIESQCVSVLEAMSSGVHSLIRRWPHPECKPEEIYPQENLFDDITECKRKILAWVKLPVKEKRSRSWQARQFIQKHHNAKIQVKKMRKAIEAV